MARDTGIGRVTWTVMLVVGLSVAVACSRTPPEQRLRGQLSAMQQAVRAQVLVIADIGLTLGPAQVELQGDRATVRFSAVASGGSGRWVPDRVQAWEIVSGWREEDGQWRLYYAEWTPK